MFHCLFYNLENFYAHDQSAQEGCCVFSNRKNWDKERYHLKLQKINHLFIEFKKRYEVLPPIIGLCEFQGPSVLTSLMLLSVWEGKYRFVCTENFDRRGMGVGMLYDVTRVKVLSSRSLQFNDGRQKRGYIPRAVLECRCEIEGKKLDIFIVHLPSKRNRDANQSLRKRILSSLEDTIIHRLGEDREVILMGDFNEDFSSSALSAHWLAPYSDRLSFSSPSSFHQGRGVYMDSIFHFVLNENRRQLRNHRIEVFHIGVLRCFEKKKIHTPFPTFKGTRYLGGVSDHFPVFSEIQ